MDEKISLAFNLKILRFVGWPGDSHLRSKALVAVHILLVGSLTCIAVLDVVNNFQENVITVPSICTVLMSFDCLMFYTTFYVKYDGFLEMVTYLREQVIRPKYLPGEEMRMIDSAERGAKRFSVFWVSMAFANTVFSIVAPVFERLAEADDGRSTSRNWPLPIGFQFGSENLATHLLAFCYLSVAVTSLNLGFGAIESLCIASMLHLNAQFKILQRSLVNLKRDSEAEVEKPGNNFPVTSVVVMEEGVSPGRERTCEHPQLVGGSSTERAGILHCSAESFEAGVHREMERRLIECIKHHNKILKSAGMLTSVYSSMMVVMVLVDVANLTFVPFGALTEFQAGSEVYTLCRYLHLFLCALFHSCFYCYTSEQMASQSELVASATYDCCWLDSPADLGRSLMMTAVRASRPVSLSIGKFNRLTLGTFEWTLRVSYTYFAVLQQVYNRS